MAIVLVPETGAGLANANTYADVAYARTFAESMGLTLPTTDDALAGALLAAMPYIEAQPYSGQRASSTQALQWPRKLATVDGNPIAENIVPEAIKKAQVTAASMIFNGTNLYPTVSGQLVTKKKVGPIETEYSDKYLATLDGRPYFTAIDIYLQPYINLYGGYRLSPRFGF